MPIERRFFKTLKQPITLTASAEGVVYTAAAYAREYDLYLGTLTDKDGQLHFNKSMPGRIVRQAKARAEQDEKGGAA